MEISGNLDGNRQKHCIIVSRFNEFITDSLLKGAVDGLIRHGVSENDITVIRVPGAFEIPAVAQKAAKTGKFHSIITLGAVIRGATSHYDLVSSESARLGDISKEAGIPVIFGVLTTDTIEQAIERAGTKAGNKGLEAAASAIEMVNLFKAIDAIQT